MGIEKPLEVERGELGPPPGPPSSTDLEARMGGLIRRHDGVVEVAGCALAVPEGVTPEPAIESLRSLLAYRMQQRRPNADDATWAHFESVARGVAREHGRFDRELVRTLVCAVDGL